MECAEDSTEFKYEEGTETLQVQIKEIIKRNQQIHDGVYDNPFFVGELGKVNHQLKKWKSLLPRIEMFYAVKCCSEPPLLELLDDLKVSFDCASKKEIETVLELGVAASRIIFANTIKTVSSLKYAAANNVPLMTFDNEEELEKIKKYSPEARLLLRIRCKTSKHVIINFGMKYGCPLDKVNVLLNKARCEGLSVVGVSFHVGSGATDPSLYKEAIRDARTVFKIGRCVGFTFHVLDIGGGFLNHGENDLTFETVAHGVNSALDQYFPKESETRIIAEPGRFLVATAYTWVVPVIGKCSNEAMNEDFVFEDGKERKVAPRFVYYVNDGQHGCMPGPDYIRKLPPCKHLPQKTINATLTYPSVVFGPTCDPDDVVYGDISLPELYIGNWLYLENSGAYSLSLATDFNMMPKASVFYI